MKKLLLTIVLLLPFIAFTQNWKKMKSAAKDRNFYEIKNAFNEALRLKKVSTNDRDYLQYKRWERFWKDRILSDGSFPNPMTAYYELKKYKLTHSHQLKSTNANWSFIGPNVIPTAEAPGYPGLGRINAITFDPNDSKIIWVGAPAGGLWKSTDEGQNWTTNTDQLPSLGISDIAIDPTDNKIMYIATGDADGEQTNSLGVMKSTDAGQTWNTTKLNYELNKTRQTARLLIHSTNTQTLVASTSDGIYYTTNGGEDWTQSTGTSGVGFCSLVFKTDDENTIFAGTSQGGHSADIYKSTDLGKTFTKLTGDLPTYKTGRIELCVTKVDANYIFAFYQDAIAYTSTDGGTKWTQLTTMPNNVSTQGGYNMCVAIAPNDKKLIILGEMNYAWRSKDGGATWEGYLDGYWQTGYPFFYVHSDHHVLKFLPGSDKILFSGNDGGLHKGDITTDDKWTDLTAGLFVTQYYALGGTPQNADFLLAGAQDNDVNHWDGSKWYDRNNNTDGVECLVDYTDSKICYTASTSGYLMRTLDGFATIETEVNTPQASAGFEWPLIMDPKTPTTIYGGWDEIYKSTNKGDNWTKITNNQLSGNVWTHIAISPSDPNTIYAGNGQKLFVTTNGGSSWTDITSNLNPTNNITRLAINATDPKTAYLTFSGYTDKDKVKKTTDLGQTWTDISGTLPNIPVKCIVYQTGANDDLYIGTDLGVYHKDKNATDWTKYGTKLPNVIVNDMEIQYGTNKLVVATFGRGIWRSPLQSNSVTNILNTKKNQSELNIYPNPSNGLININIDNNESEIVIYNVVGGVIKYIKNVNKGKQQINLSNSYKGLYFVTVKSKNNIKTSKVILK